MFDYQESLAGVTFEVYAAEDKALTHLIRFTGKDSLYTEIKINDKGIASIENLPLGKYYLVETKTLKACIRQRAYHG